MSEKTEEQIAKERASVEAMRNAKANMDAALSRISTLETALTSCVKALRETKGFISPNVYTYPVQNQTTSVHARIDYWADLGQKALG